MLPNFVVYAVKYDVGLVFSAFLLHVDVANVNAASLVLCSEFQ